ncbi:MAG: bifunctional metallophosphatase/5'-nucleotidase [Planctomycetota bacterium]
MRLLLWLLLPATALAGEPVRLVVLHTNDLHGQLAPLPPSPVRPVLRGKPAGGFAHLAAMVRTTRREAADRGAGLLLLDAGDIFQGTPIGNETRGEAVIEAMNALAYDAGTLGNHEFDYGPANMLRLVERARFPILAANMAGAENVKPYVLFGPPKTPCRICVIGLITPATPAITTPGVTRGLTFADPAPVVRSLLKEVDADLFVVVSHLGREDELRLAREVEGLALIVGGHSHTPYVQKVGETLVSQTHARGMSLGRVDLDLDPRGFKILRAEGKLLPVDPGATEPDPRVQAVIEKYGQDLDARLKQVVGRLAAPLRRSRGLVSSPAGNWMADVIRRAGEAQIGFMNKGGIRTDLEAGDVTAGDVYRLMPFDNTVMAMDLTGAELHAILARHLAPGRFPGLEWSGLLVEVEKNGEIVSVRVGNAPLDETTVYRVATNSFLAAGGDGFTMFRQGRRRARGGLVRDALAGDLAAQSPLTPPTEQRLRVRRTAQDTK